MHDPLLYPALRWPLEVRREKIDQEEIILLRCPLGISPEPLLLKAAIAPVLSCFEGKLSIAEITSRFARYGVHEQLIRDLADLLDRHLFLSTPKFKNAEEAIKREFQELPVRLPALAGLSYPGERGELQAHIDSYLKPNVAIPEESLLCLVSPHIDYRRGGHCYGATYPYISSDRSPIFVLIGTAHQYSPRLFHVAVKDFECPLGVAHCEKQVLTRLVDRVGPRCREDEFLHKQEHSLELQLPFLMRRVQTATILPILVGGFHSYLRSGKFPPEYDEYETFVGSLTEELRGIEASGREICFIAGVDMAHVGKHFGDAVALTPEYLERISERDETYLRKIEAQDKIGLFTHIEEDLDARRICGFPTMYTVLDILDRLGKKTSTRRFSYDQAVNYATDCCVTFAGLGMYS